MPNSDAKAKALARIADPELRAGGLHALSEVAPQACVPFALKHLHDDDEMARYHAIEALMKADAWGHADRIAQLLDDPEEMVRANALDYLGRSNAEGYAKRILPFLEDSDAYVRTYAGWALGELGADEISNCEEILRAALERETDLEARVGIASGLFELTRYPAELSVHAEVYRTGSAGEKMSVVYMLRGFDRNLDSDAPAALLAEIWPDFSSRAPNNNSIHDEVADAVKQILKARGLFREP